MRTTLTIEPAIARQIRTRMLKKNMTLKDVINQTLRAGLQSSKSEDTAEFDFKVEPHACGFRAGIDQDKLNQFVDELDVEAAAAKLLR